MEWRAGIRCRKRRISGQVIIDQLIRNMELGQFEMAYSVLLPCIFSLYLHPDDYARLTGVFDLIREDAKRALAARLEQLNAKPLGLGVMRSAARSESRTRSPARIGRSNSFRIPKAWCRWATSRFTPS